MRYYFDASASLNTTILELFGPYTIGEITENFPEFGYYLENPNSISLPVRHKSISPNQAYNKAHYEFEFDEDTILFDENFLQVRAGGISELKSLFAKKGTILQINDDGTIPPFIKMLPEIEDVFENSTEAHRKYCFPLFSIHLKEINPQWNDWIHVVEPVCFLEYDELSLTVDLDNFAGWEPSTLPI